MRLASSQTSHQIGIFQKLVSPSSFNILMPEFTFLSSVISQSWQGAIAHSFTEVGARESGRERGEPDADTYL